MAKPNASESIASPRPFTRFSKHAAHLAGRPAAFAAAVAIVLAWAVSGPIFGFSDTWQLVINTGTTIITFLMVFVIQNTQNRDTVAMQIKLDELVRATRGATNTLLDLEELEESELKELQARYEALAAKARHVKEERGKGGGRGAKPRRMEGST